MAKYRVSAEELIKAGYKHLIVSIHQPAYLPWLGYLDRIGASDAFVFLDTVQFEKNSFTNRNVIKTPNGPLWLTVPVLSQGHLERTLLELRIDNRRNWKKKHLRSIEQNYNRAPLFGERFPKLVDLFDVEDALLSELCFRQLKFWLGEFRITTPVFRASELGISGRKADLILALCRQLGASTYLSGPQGRNYLDEYAFAAMGISVRYHDYVTHPYPQLFGAFSPAISVLDNWMNVSNNTVSRSAA